MIFTHCNDEKIIIGFVTDVAILFYTKHLNWGEGLHDLGGNKK